MVPTGRERYRSTLAARRFAALSMDGEDLTAATLLPAAKSAAARAPGRRWPASTRARHAARAMGGERVQAARACSTDRCRCGRGEAGARRGLLPSARRRGRCARTTEHLFERQRLAQDMVVLEGVRKCATSPLREPVGERLSVGGLERFLELGDRRRPTDLEARVASEARQRGGTSSGTRTSSSFRRCAERFVRAEAWYARTFSCSKRRLFMAPCAVRPRQPTTTWRARRLTKRRSCSDFLRTATLRPCGQPTGRPVSK